MVRWWLVSVLWLTLPSVVNAAVVWTEGVVKEVSVAIDQDSVQVSFPLRNTSDQVLVVSDVKTSCGCTTVNQAEQRIEPGQVSSVDFAFEVGNRTGVNKKTATVTFDERAGVAPQQLKMTFNIASLVAAQGPRVITFQGRRPEQGWAQQSLRVALTDPQVQIIDIDASDAPSFEVALRATADEQAWFIDVLPKVGVDQKRVLESIYLMTNHPLERYQRLRYRCYVVAQPPDNQ